MAKLTKRDIVVSISNQTGMVQHQVFDVVQKTLDKITDSLANNIPVELRNFGVFLPRLTRPRIGRNPNQPGSSFVIPPRATVKFKAGKIMRQRVEKLARDTPIDVNPRYYQRPEEIALPALVHTEMRLEHFGRVHFFVAQFRFAQNFRLQFELHELLDAPALHQHLWSFLVDRHAQLVLLRKKNGPILRRELEPGLLEQTAKLPHLLRRK